MAKSRDKGKREVKKKKKEKAPKGAPAPFSGDAGEWREGLIAFSEKAALNAFICLAQH